MSRATHDWALRAAYRRLAGRPVRCFPHGWHFGGIQVPESPLGRGRNRYFRHHADDVKPSESWRCPVPLRNDLVSRPLDEAKGILDVTDPTCVLVLGVVKIVGS